LFVVDSDANERVAGKKPGELEEKNKGLHFPASLKGGEYSGNRQAKIPGHYLAIFLAEKKEGGTDPPLVQELTEGKNYLKASNHNRIMPEKSRRERTTQGFEKPEELDFLKNPKATRYEKVLDLDQLRVKIKHNPERYKPYFKEIINIIRGLDGIEKPKDKGRDYMRLTNAAGKMIGELIKHSGNHQPELVELVLGQEITDSYLKKKLMGHSLGIYADSDKYNTIKELPKLVIEYITKHPDHPQAPLIMADIFRERHRLSDNDIKKMIRWATTPIKPGGNALDEGRLTTLHGLWKMRKTLDKGVVEKIREEYKKGRAANISLEKKAKAKERMNAVDTRRLKDRKWAKKGSKEKERVESFIRNAPDILDDNKYYQLMGGVWRTPKDRDFTQWMLHDRLAEALEKQGITMTRRPRGGIDSFKLRRDEEDYYNTQGIDEKRIGDLRLFEYYGFYLKQLRNKINKTTATIQNLEQMMSRGEKAGEAAVKENKKREKYLLRAKKNLTTRIQKYLKPPKDPKEHYNPEHSEKMLHTVGAYHNVINELANVSKPQTKEAIEKRLTTQKQRLEHLQNKLEEQKPTIEFWEKEIENNPYARIYNFSKDHLRR
jgi:hypothetical protein